MKKPPIPHGARNIASWLPENRLTSAAPATDATGTQTPSTPATMPRSVCGTWSARTAACAAISALKNTCAMHHPTSTIATFGASAMTRIPQDPPPRPTIIQVRRMPKRGAVRLPSMPKNGFAKIASSAPTPATSARLFGACSIPTSELTFNARVTTRGARNRRHVLK